MPCVTLPAYAKYLTHSYTRYSGLFYPADAVAISVRIKRAVIDSDARPITIFCPNARAKQYPQRDLCCPDVACGVERFGYDTPARGACWNQRTSSHLGQVHEIEVCQKQAARTSCALTAKP